PCATAPPSVDEQHTGPAVAPGPGRHAPAAHHQVEPPPSGQPRRHALADRAAGRRAEQPLRPPRREPGRCTLNRPERGASKTQSCAHELTVKRLRPVRGFGINCVVRPASLAANRGTMLAFCDPRQLARIKSLSGAESYG